MTMASCDITSKRQFEFTALDEEQVSNRLKIPKLSGAFSTSSSPPGSPSCISSEVSNSLSYHNSYDRQGLTNSPAQFEAQSSVDGASADSTPNRTNDSTSPPVRNDGDVNTRPNICLGSIQHKLTNAPVTAISNGERSRSIVLLQMGNSLRVFTNVTAKGEYLGGISQKTASMLISLMGEYTVEFENFLSPISTLDSGFEGLWISIDIYCRRCDAIKIGRVLARDKSYLTVPCQNKKRLTYSNPHILKVSEEIRLRLLSEGVMVTTQDKPKQKGKTGRPSVQEQLEREDEISNLFTTARDAEADSMDLDFQISHQIATTLKEHQYAGVRWMLKNEGSFDQHGSTNPLKGGILADDMGMGKSLTTLALIATSFGYSSDSHTTAAIPTLIICPKSVVSAWEDQINHHTRNIKYLVYNAGEWKDRPPKFEDYQIVITTFGQVASQYKTKKSTLSTCHWRRVVLDEAHIIRERTTNQAKAAFALRSDFRWCLTGTPVQNKLDDYGSLLEFIQYPGYDDRKTFQSKIVKPLRLGNQQGLRSLIGLISDTTLRRLKGNSSLNLPPRKDLIQRLRFNEGEAALHKQLHQFAENKIHEAVKNGAKGSGAGPYVTQLILRLRQVCNHGVDLLPPSLQQQLQHFEDKKSGFAISSTFDQLICERCKETEKDESNDMATFENCQHVICKSCDPIDGECPLCLDAHQDIASTSKIAPSTKVQELIRNLKANLNTKKVVFSCWTKMLDLVEVALARHEIGFIRIEGSLTMSERRTRIELFREDPGCTVFLATLGSGSVGLDLTTASEVHLLEPQFNPMLEEQALARVHRIGQTKPVTTIRYIMQKSYEEQILERQSKKLQLAELCASGTVKANSGVDKYLECLNAVIK